MVAVVALLTTTAVGCSRTGYLADPDGRFDATWIVEDMTAEGDPVDLESANILVDIDTRIAAVTVETGCRTLLGSYTLADDGRAGFTLPGTKGDCGGAEPWLADLDATFLTAVSTVDSWTISGDRLELAGPDTSLVLERAR